MAVPDTLRGFRTQFLYTLYRAIIDDNNDYIYIPEGEEDLDIYCADTLIEAIQVKNLATQVVYSDLTSSGKTTSFFQRGEFFLERFPEVKLKLVSFHGVSQEFTNEYKLKKKIQTNKHVKSERIDDVIQAFSSENVDEDVLYDQITVKLKSKYPTFNPEKEIHYLLQWIYNLAEKSLSFTLIDLNRQLLSFREFESAQKGATAHLGIRVKRLFADTEIEDEEIASLKSGFNKGISVMQKHIVAGVDLKRPKWLKQIEKVFKLHNTVIVHGASGQGKSALCYRYAYDYYSIAFEISNLTPVLLPEIIATIEQISKGLKIPVLIYMDIKPGESDWLDLLKEFSEDNLIHLLISVREEDWNQNLSRIKHLTQFAEIPIALTQEEAKQIYSQLNPNGSLKDFFDIWETLGESTPLLEYIYYLNNQQSLRSRLEYQYQSLSVAQRKLLAHIIIPNYLGSSVSISALQEIEGDDPFVTLLDIKFLENEYFRCDGDSLVDLHPIRTSILKDIITSDNISVLQNIGCSWINSASINNRQRYLINLLKAGVTPQKITQSVHKNTPIDCSLWLDVMMALLWQGCKEYVDENQDYIDMLYNKIGMAYEWFIPINLTDIDAINSIHSIFKDDEDLFNECRRLMNLMDNQLIVFKYIRKWIEETPILLSAITETDYKAFGKALYILSLANLCDYIKFPEFKISKSNDCEGESLAYLLLGLKSTNSLQNHWEQLESLFIEKVRKELNIYKLTISDSDIDARIFLNLCNSFDSDELNEDRRIKHYSQFIHSKVLRVCEYFRMAFPDKLSYNSSIECGKLTGDMIDTEKNISHAKLPVRLMHIPRQFVCGICAQRFKTPSKYKYFEETIKNRQIIIGCCSKLSQVLKDILSGANLSKSIKIFSESWDALIGVTQVELPQGMFDMLSLEEDDYNQENKERVYKNVKTYSSTLQKYQNNLLGFLKSSPELFLSKSINIQRFKFLLYEALKNTVELKEQTLLLRNPYLPTKDLSDLCKKEEKILKKLLQQCTFYGKKTTRKIYHDSHINDSISDNYERLINRYVSKLGKIFTEYGLGGNIRIEHKVMKITLEYRSFALYPHINVLVRVILLTSLLSPEWPSSEQYMLENAVNNVEVFPLYRDRNGKVINLTGISYNIPTSDIINLSESQNWQFFLKMEKDSSHYYPDELRQFDSLKGIVLEMLLIGSQTEEIGKEISPDDHQGQVMLNKLYQSYKQSISTCLDIIYNCKQIFSADMLGSWIEALESVYTLIESEYANDNWVKSTQKTREILDMLTKIDNIIRRAVIVDLGYDVDI